MTMNSAPSAVVVLDIERLLLQAEKTLRECVSSRIARVLGCGPTEQSVIESIKLSDFWFTMKDAESAGVTNRAVITSWLNKNLLNTKLPAEKQRGKERKYPLAAIYEVVIMSHLSKFGVLLSECKKINSQILNGGATYGVVLITSPDFMPRYMDRGLAIKKIPHEMRQFFPSLKTA